MDFRLNEVLQNLAADGPLSGKARHAAQAAVSAIPTGEHITAAFRCGIASGATQGHGVAVLTPRTLSVFDRRGFRSLDEKFLLRLNTPFTVETDPATTLLTIAFAGGPRTTLDLLRPDAVEAFRRHLEPESGDEEHEGWWSAAPISWPGWLGSSPCWAYLGGDPHMPEAADGLRVHVGPNGVSLEAADGAARTLKAWPEVVSLRVHGAPEGRRQADAAGLPSSPAFGPAWGRTHCSTFLLLGSASGQDIFLGTNALDERTLRNRLLAVAAAMAPAPAPPGGEEGGVPGSGLAAAEITLSGTNEPTSLVERLERLRVLHEQGALDDDEFRQAKATLLAGS